MAIDELINGIRRGEVERLVRIPGVGRKTAERMVLELRDKLPVAGASDTSMGAPQASPVEEDVISALVNLGYPRAAAEKALLAARSGKSPQSFDMLFREALGSLSK